VRSIPSIEQLRQRDAMRALEARHGRAALVEALRIEAAALRARVADGAAPGDAGAAIEAAVAVRLEQAGRPSLRRVINATGVIVHTNLGRAPLAAPAAQRAAALGSGYTNLEYDLDAGARGKRDTHAERLICRLTGAEAAVVVNNNAAATMLVLAALARGREVIVSRGELVEIGGGFRVPDVMAQSGAVLREVGTTNRTRAADYAASITDRTALILRVHPSNFRIEGFTERPSLAELAALGQRFNVPVVEDLGSGLLGGGPRGSGYPGADVPALREEPVVAASIAAGAAVVMFSGDKLVGGPQAGIIAGTTAMLAQVRTHPLMRALRVDKLTYAALEATLEEHAAGRAARTVPVWRMMTMAVDEIERRARAFVAALGTGTVIDGTSTIGGGSAPGSTLPTRLVAIDSTARSVTEIEARLRLSETPVIARIEDNRLLLDLRTVEAADDAPLVVCLRQALSRRPRPEA
jgi:L-seryl-tRNA(Ser) seleniumtransferase